MARCETSRLRTIPCLVSCLPQRILHGNVKTVDVIFKKMDEESTRAVELALEGHSLFISGHLLLAASCCVDFLVQNISHA